MKRGILLLCVLVLSAYIYAEDIKLVGIDHDVIADQAESESEQVLISFDSSDYKFKIEEIRLGQILIVITAPDNTLIIDPPGKFADIQVSSDKVSDVRSEIKEGIVYIHINLKNRYRFKANKVNEKLRVYILSDLIEEKEKKPTKADAESYEAKYQKWEDKLAERDEFFYRGFLLATLNYAVIEGNTLSYSNGVFEFDEGLSSRQKLSFMGDGKIFDDYYLTVQAFYDPLDDSGYDYKAIRDFYFYARIENGLNYLSVGDHDKETFTDLYLSRFTQSFLGVEAHFETKPVAATAFAAISKGGVQVQEFQADNTTGPYQLTRTPVVSGSELVTLEERDRNSPTRVLSSEAQTRGVDYFIDYEEGEITFVTPVEKETFDRNPLYIVIRYQYEQSGSSKEYVVAAKVDGRPLDGVSIGASYISKFGDDGFDVRDQLFGLNASVDTGESFQLFSEYSLSKPEGKEGDEAAAYYLQMQGRVGNKVQYRGTYQRIEDGFENIANTRLALYNNQARMDGEVLYFIDNANTLTLGYRAEETNLESTDDDPAVLNSTLYGLYQLNSPDLPVVSLRYDLVNRSDDNEGEEKTVDSTTNEVTVNIEKFFNIFGQTGLQVIYRYSDIADEISVEDSGTVNLYGFKFINRPFERISVFAEYRNEVTESEGIEDYDYTILGVGGKFSPFSELSLDVRYENRERENTYSNIMETEEKILSVGGSYLISSALRFVGRYEQREVTDLTDTGNDQESKTANVRFFAHPFNNFRVGLGFEMEDRISASYGNTRSYEDRLLIEGSYKKKDTIEFYARYQIDLNSEEYPPLDETEITNTINLVGLRFWLGERIDFFGRYKTQEIKGANDNTLETITVEGAYKLHEKYKLILGYEAANFDQPSDLSENYEANNFYIRLAAIF